MQEVGSEDDFQDNEVEIVDLGAPDKGFSRFLFFLGKKGRPLALSNHDLCL